MARSRRFASKKVSDKEHGEFDSTIEYNYFLVLLERQRKGEIEQLERQREFLLVPKFKDSYGNTVLPMKYISDFTYIENGKLVVVDCKGSLYNITIESKNKIKMCKYLYQDIRFEIILRLDGEWFNVEDKVQKKRYNEIVKNNKLKKKSKKK